jgi:hypothetical protein
MLRPWLRGAEIPLRAGSPLTGQRASYKGT